MNLLFTKLKHDLWSAEKIEAYIAKMEADIARYHKVEQSAELKEYNELKKIVESKEFQDNKAKLLKTKYKDTEFYRTMNDFNKAGRSLDYRKYKAIHANENIAAYFEFIKTPEAAMQLADKEALKKDSRLRMFRLIDGSLMMKDYHKNLEHSKYVLDYFRLKDVVATEEFQTKNAFWADAKRWYTTEEAKQDKRFEVLSKNEDLLFFFKADAKALLEFESIRPVFIDNMAETDLNKAGWKAGFAYKNKNCKAVHSYTDQLQAYMGGTNVTRMSKQMTIRTLAQKVSAAAWDEKKGFVMKDFDYTSDVIQTADSFRTDHGMIMAKVRFTGDVNHSILLLNEEKKDIITLIQAKGRKMQLGIQSAKENKMQSISGLHPDQWHYFILAWTEKEIIWHVNNFEVLRMPNTLGKTQLYFQAQSWLPAMINGKKQSGDKGNMDIQFIGVYTK